MSMSQSSFESLSYSSNKRCHCDNRSFSSYWNYCPYCGRPINIGISRGSTIPSRGTTAGGFESSHETTGISFGQGRNESGWTKDIGTSTGWDSGDNGTSHS